MSVRHKHLKLEQSKIDKARRLFGAKTEQETVERALDLVIAEDPILRAHRKIKNAGGLSDIFSVKKVVLDTNVYIDWINRGLGEERILGGGLIRYLSAIVVMELRAGARTRSGRSAIDHLVRPYAAGGRLVTPSVPVFEHAGSLLRRLKLAGREVRSAAFVNDVLIALSARSIGATVVTTNVRDFEAIRRLEPFALEEA